MPGAPLFVNVNSVTRWKLRLGVVGVIGLDNDQLMAYLIEACKSDQVILCYPRQVGILEAIQKAIESIESNRE